MDLPAIGKGCGEAYAIENPFVGKESSFDHLESTSKEGKITNCDLSSMKWIPTSCIEYYAKLNNRSVLNLYSQLSNGVSIDFGLTNGNVFLETIKITLGTLYMKVRKELQEPVNL